MKISYQVSQELRKSLLYVVLIVSHPTAFPSSSLLWISARVPCSSPLFLMMIIDTGVVIPIQFQYQHLHICIVN